MDVLLPISLLAVLLTLFESKGWMRNGMAWGFIIVTIVASLRCDYGNDWPAYEAMFELFSKYNVTLSNFDSFGLRDEEPGWLLLNMLFRNVSFQWFVVTLTIFNSVIYYMLIRTYVPLNLRPFAVFIYLFNSNFFVLGLSMMRQTLAITMIAATLPLILRNRILVPLLVILAASTIHMSAIVALPILLIGMLPEKGSIYRWIVASFVVLFVVVSISSKEVFAFFLNFITENEDMSRYAVYDDNSFVTYGLGYLIGLIPYILGLIYLWQNSIHHTIDKKVVLLTMIGALVIPLGSAAQMVGRVAYYFTVFSIVTFPQLFYNKEIVKNNVFRGAFIALFVFIMLYTYYGFFHSPIWRDAYLEYKTIFSSMS
ncbi:MAG: EpsG family protein [Rikenellaceae bacterium]|nr:EpsG family protein [Rikenellaceae bacterium]